MNIIFKSENTEYSNIIETFFKKNNPIFHCGTESRVDAIMEILIGTRQTRIGPSPSIEQQFHMRTVVRKYIEQNLPIPVLIPSGPKKTVNNESIDVLEWNIANLLNCINTKIKEHYKPGLNIVIRLEDLTGSILEPDCRDDITRYCADFIKMIKILEYNFIEPALESNIYFHDHKSFDLFHKTVSNNLNIFKQYFQTSEKTDISNWENLPEYKELQNQGWNGIIPPDQRTFYHNKYQKLYPNLTVSEHTELMLKYFATSLTRKQLNYKGNKKEWNNEYLEIMFQQPIPDYTYPTRFHYRTVELNDSKKTLSFWRAKGILKIKNNNSIRLSSITYSDAAELTLTPGYIEITNKSDTLKIKCDIYFE